MKAEFNQMGVTDLSKFVMWIEQKLNPVYLHLPGSYKSLIYKLLQEHKKVLDVGCGDGTFLRSFHLAKTTNIDGVEVYRPYIKLAKKNGPYKKIYIQNLNQLAINKKYDLVLFSHVIEHLTKEKGNTVLKKLEKITQKRLLVISPVGDLHQDVYDGNSHQEHISAWYPSDFKKLGFSVHTFGFKPLLRSNDFIRSYGVLGYMPLLLSFILTPLTKLNPNWGCYMVCFKDVS